MTAFTYLLVAVFCAAQRLSGMVVCRSGDCGLHHALWVAGALYFVAAAAALFIRREDVFLRKLLLAAAACHAAFFALGAALWGVRCLPCGAAAVAHALAAAQLLVPPGKKWVAAACAAGVLVVLLCARLFSGYGVPVGVPDAVAAAESTSAETPGERPHVSDDSATAAKTAFMSMGNVSASATPGTAVAGTERLSTEREENAGPKEPDAKQASNWPPSIIEVSLPGGEKTKLDLTEKPALLFAAWCKGCEAALKDAAVLPESERPYLVAVCRTDADVDGAKDKLAAAGLAGKSFYVLRDFPYGVQGVPALLWWDGELKSKTGRAVLARKP